VHRRLIEYPAGDGEQAETVDEGDKYLEAVETESKAPIGRPARNAERRPGQGKGNKSANIWPASAISASESEKMPLAISPSINSPVSSAAQPTRCSLLL